MVARVRQAPEVRQEKARIKSIADPVLRRQEYEEFSGRFIPRLRKMKSLDHRVKSLATIQNGDELEPVPFDHPLAKIFHEPNSIDVAYTFAYKIGLYLELTGSCYIWVVRNKWGQPVELWTIPSQWVGTRAGEKTLVKEYEITPRAGYIATEFGGGWWPGGSGTLTLPAEDVIAIHYPNPVNFIDGYAPLSAVAEWIDVSEAIDKSRVAHFVNGMFPGVAIEMEKDLADPSPDAIHRLKADIQAKYSGVRKTKEPVILGPGMKLVPVSSTPEEMDYVASADQLKSWVLAAHRVSPSIVGLAEETTFASMVASRANFHASTIRPKLVLLGQIFTRWLAPLFEDGEDLIVYWEDSLPKDPDFELRKNMEYLKNGVVTVNEIRADDGREPYPYGGDDPMMPMGLSPVPWQTGDEPDDALLPSLAALERPKQDAASSVESGVPEASETTDSDRFAQARADLMRNLAKPKSLAAMLREPSVNGHVNGRA